MATLTGITPDAHTFDIDASTGWRTVFAAGAFSVALGVLVLSFKVTTLWTVAVFAALTLALVGVVELISAMQDGRSRPLRVAGGLFALAGGVILFTWPEATLFVIGTVYAITIASWGLSDLLAALRSGNAYRVSLFVRGVLSLAVGVWLLGQPGLTLLFVVTLAGLWSVAFGLVNIYIAFRLRTATKVALS